jgi:tripartite-type tricarboxylate transporter receptor subunit TctC
LPDVPTLQEAALRVSMSRCWQAFYVARGYAGGGRSAAQRRIGEDRGAADVKAKLDSLGVEHTANTPAQFADYNRAELAKWQKVVKDGKVQP